MASGHTTRVTLVGVTQRPHGRLSRLRPGRRDPVAPLENADALGRVAKRPTRWKVVTPVVGVLTGALFVVSAHSSQGTDLRPGRYTDLASLVSADAQQYDGLKNHVTSLSHQVEALSETVNNKHVVAMDRQADRMKGPAGLLPVSGPGVTVTLSDAHHSIDQNTPDNLNLLLVHQQDIQAVVNAMWKGGADAVTIQGQRVVTTTGIRCIGNSVQLQGVPYGQPYVISAVGDPTSLTRSIATDPYLKVYRADARDPDIAVGWNEKIESRITAPAYDGLLGMSYAKVLAPASSGSASAGHGAGGLGRVR
jgi:uncharacterized protein YlxW (UPF0749 family)